MKIRNFINKYSEQMVINIIWMAKKLNYMVYFVFSSYLNKNHAFSFCYVLYEYPVSGHLFETKYNL